MSEVTERWIPWDAIPPLFNRYMGASQGGWRVCRCAFIHDISVIDWPFIWPSVSA
jgi:hypothetical protein